MSEQITGQDFFRRHRRFWFLLPLLALLFVVVIIVFSLSDRPGERGLKPLRLTPTPNVLLLDGEVVELTFTDLNAAPSAYRNRRLRVTGDYLALAILDCRPSTHSGPVFTWALAAEGLQLNARHFESVLRNTPDGFRLTVEGIWRVYEGPLGCGKNAPRGIAWYLAVERIIDPNPLPIFSGPPRPTTAVILPGQSEFPVIPAPIPAMTPTPPAPDSSPSPTATATALTPGAGQSTLTPTVTPTAGPGTIFPSVTPIVTNTPGGSLPPGTATVTPTPATAISPTPDGIIPPPPIPTGPGYPGQTPDPNPSVTPTPTPSSYN
jgi:hypothetical protein